MFLLRAAPPTAPYYRRAARLYLRHRLAKIFKLYRVGVVELLLYGNIENISTYAFTYGILIIYDIMLK